MFFPHRACSAVPTSATAGYGDVIGPSDTLHDFRPRRRDEDTKNVRRHIYLKLFIQECNLNFIFR